MNIKTESVVVGAISFVSFCAGGGLAYYLTKRHLTTKYETLIQDEVAAAKAFYTNVYKADYPTPQDAAAVLLPEEEQLVEAASALRSYQGSSDVVDDTEVDEERVEEFVEQNLFENKLTIDKEARSQDLPYVVEYDEYYENPDEFDNVSLTYYGGDNVLATDDDDKSIEPYEVDRIVGEENLKYFGVSDPDDPHIVLIRNEKLKTQYEITYNQGKYAHIVLGFEHSDEVRSRRGRPQWND